GGKRALIVISLMLPLIAVVEINLTIGHAENSVRSIWVNSLVQFQFFGYGALLAILLDGRVPRFRFWHRALILSASFLLFISGDVVFHINYHVAKTSTASLGYMAIGLGCVGLILGVM